MVYYILFECSKSKTQIQTDFIISKWLIIEKGALCNSLSQMETALAFTLYNTLKTTYIYFSFIWHDFMQCKSLLCFAFIVIFVERTYKIFILKSPKTTKVVFGFLCLANLFIVRLDFCKMVNDGGSSVAFENQCPRPF